jgi:hypothetical protein
VFNVFALPSMKWSTTTKESFRTYLVLCSESGNKFFQFYKFFHGWSNYSTNYYKKDFAVQIAVRYNPILSHVDTGILPVSFVLTANKTRSD